MRVRTYRPKRKPSTNVAPGFAGALTNTTSPIVAGVPNVQYTRPELRGVLSKYRRIADCIAGEDAVKARRELYLPRPNASDESDENNARYEAYLERAVFYSVTYRTVHALVGQVFLRDPQKTLPSSFDPIVADANGENVGLDQLAKICTRHTVAFGRSGLHVDYTTAPSGVTAAQQESGDYRPIISEYSGADIINWRKARRGARMVFTLIVIRENFGISDDGFETKTGIQYKVLRLVSATPTFRQHLHRKTMATSGTAP